MIFQVEVTPGAHTTELDLVRMVANIRIALNDAVQDVAVNLFPEFTFGPVTEGVCETADERAERKLDEAYVAQHARPAYTPPF
jgi:hypothetical protein